jgi:hypothetical protein
MIFWLGVQFTELDPKDYRPDDCLGNQPSGKPNPTGKKKQKERGGNEEE